MKRSFGAWTGVLLALASARFAHPADLGNLSLTGGTQMGFTDGMNGAPWPALLKDPLSNNNRAGFYITQARLAATYAFDSTFSGTAVWNAIYMDLPEAYLTKKSGDYTLRAGKFRGAGLKSISQEDEFSRVLVNAPRYARYWAFYARTLNGRDFGLELERDAGGGWIRNRLFIRNGTQENVVNDEPSFNAGKVTQVLGIDYALDWRISPYTVWGGHIGMLADRQWDQFVGSHEGWQAQYWFKSNAVADGSLNHSLDVGRFHMSNEALLMYLRDLPQPLDSSATQLWGLSSRIQFDHSERWSSVFRYEFDDPSDGLYPEDGLHIFTLAALFRPAPLRYPGMRFTTEYVRAYEETLLNPIPNDLFYFQFQMVF